MKYLISIVFSIIIAYLVWPYIHVYQLGKAVEANNQVALTKLIDLTSVRKIHKDYLQWRLQQTVDGSGLVPDILRQGVTALSHTAIDTVVDLSWIRQQLQQSADKKVSFAIFESPTCFIVRIGQLGQNPVHVRMTLQDWVWQVTAIYV